MAQRRMGIIGFLLLACLCLLPRSAQAVSTADAIEPVSTEAACSLTLTYAYHGTAFSGVPVKLYQIADVSADAQYTLTASFRSSGLILNGIQSSGEWNVVRSTLESHILAHAIEADFSAVTNPAGQVRFESLKPGLYLATAEDAVQDELSCFFEPALVALPGLNAEGRWQYQIAVTPKPGALPPITPDGPEIQFKVLKLWKDETDRTTRPESIEVEIFRNGTHNQTVTLSENNHWTYSWTAKDDGADWMVVERNIPDGYTVTVEERSTAFILTNTRTPDEPPPDNPPDEPPPDNPPPEDPPSEEPPTEDLPPEEPPKDHPPTDSPKTGDTPHILLYTVLMYVSGIILILLGITGKKKRA